MLLVLLVAVAMLLILLRLAEFAGHRVRHLRPGMGAMAGGNAIRLPIARTGP